MERRMKKNLHLAPVKKNAYKVMVQPPKKVGDGPTPQKSRDGTNFTKISGRLLFVRKIFPESTCFLLPFFREVISILEP